MVVAVEEEDGSDVGEKKAVVEEQEEKGEGQQPVVIREQEEMGKPAEAQAPPFPLPAPAPPLQQEHPQVQQQQSESPPPPPPQPQQQQQQQLPAKAPPTSRPPPTLQELPAGLGALIARSDPFGTWCGVRDDAGEHGDEDLNKRTGISTGYMVSIFGGWAKEPGCRRPTRPRRERVREKENRHPPASIMLDTGTSFI